MSVILANLSVLLLSGPLVINQSISYSNSEMEEKFGMITKARSVSEETASYKNVLKQAKQFPSRWVRFLLKKSLSQEVDEAWTAATLLSESETLLGTTVMADIAFNGQHWTVRNVALRHLEADFDQFRSVIAGLSFKRFGITEALAFTILLKRDPKTADEVFHAVLHTVPTLDEDSLIGAKRVFSSGAHLLKEVDKQIVLDLVVKLKQYSSSSEGIKLRLAELIEVCNRAIARTSDWRPSPDRGTSS